MWIERSFEAEHRDIDLIVRPMNQADAVDFSYGVDEARAALADPNSEGYQDLIEIDTVILGSLVNSGAIQPFTVEGPRYFDFARQAVEIGGRTYGVPHWTCGYFVMTAIDDAANAETAAELRTVLASKGSTQPDLGGDIVGSWTSVSVYLDAYLDTHPTANPAEALDDTALDGRVRAALAEVGAACTSSGTGLCDREDAGIAQEFASGRLDALVGYSERLYPVLADPNKRLVLNQVRITPAPLGVGKTAILFTDALVQSSACSADRCQDAARKFAEFYVSDAVMEGAMMSADLGASATPRYLLPSTPTAINGARVAEDPIYRQLAPVLVSARPFPNSGVPEARKRGKIREAVDALLHPSP
jgi:thiamine pyridinylase